MILHKTSPLVVIALTIAVTAQLQAGTIGINFTSPSALLAPSDQPGIAPGGNWNNLFVPSGTNIPLKDSTGAPTSARVTYVAAGGTCPYPITTSTPNAATNAMYACTLNGGDADSEVIIELTDIPYARYALYTYTDLVGPSTVSITDGKTTFYYDWGGVLINTVTSLVLTTSTNPLNPTSGPAQYQIFSDLSASSITVKTGGSNRNFLSNNVAGLQIVELTATPEPASLLLMVSGAGLGLVILRRRTGAKHRSI